MRSIMQKLLFVYVRRAQESNHCRRPGGPDADQESESDVQGGLSVRFF